MRCLHWLAKLLTGIVMVLGFVAPVSAEYIVPLEAQVEARSRADAIVFNGTFEFEPSQEILDVLRRGISLTFILEAKITKNRWYWVDKTVGERKEALRLSYSPLTRQYRTNLGGITQNFDSLEQALRFMSTVKNLVIRDYRNVESEDYEASARLYLDVSRLPKPFQVSIKRGSGWNMDTGWFDVKIVSVGE